MGLRFSSKNDVLFSLVSRVRSNARLKYLIYLCEFIVFGSKVRSYFCDVLVAAYLRSLFRRRFIWQVWGEPHFTDVRGLLHSVYRGEAGEDIYSLTRAFSVMEIVREGDVCLDIGCGDGGLTKRFLAPKAKHIDAVDIEQSAISSALCLNPSPNISYYVLDIINDEWPSKNYDLIVLDGALGHLSNEDSLRLLSRISAAILHDGVFCGSESLGNIEGHDHLQFFLGEEELRSLLTKHFNEVALRVV